MLFIEGEELVAQARHSLEHGARFGRDVGDDRLVEISVGVERHEYTDHETSRSVRSEATAEGKEPQH